MGRVHRFIGIDESGAGTGNVPMIFVAAFSRNMEDALYSSHVIGKRRHIDPNEEIEYDFIYTIVKHHATQDTRIKAVCDLLAYCKVGDSDQVIVDAFGHDKRVRDRIVERLSSYSISVNGNLLVVHDADRRYPIVNQADHIAYVLGRLNGRNPFRNREVPFLPFSEIPEAQRYVDHVYKTAR